MKQKNSAIWIVAVVLVVAVVGVAVYFGNTGTQKGTLKSFNKKYLPDLTVVPVNSGTISATSAGFKVTNIGRGPSGPFYVKMIWVPSGFESSLNPPVYSYFRAVRGLAVGEESFVGMDADFEHTNAIAIGIDLDSRIIESTRDNNYFMWSKETPNEAPFASQP